MDAREVADLVSSTRGDVRFVEREAVAALRGASGRASSVLVVDVGTLGSSARGQLGEFIEAAVEEAIAARGAAAPGVGASSDRDASLSDQLFRARCVGVRALVVALGPLDALCSASHVLDPEDSAALGFWAGATQERPIVLLLDASSKKLGAYRAPVPLASLWTNDEAAEEPRVESPPPPEAPAPPPAPDTWVDDGEWRAHADELAAARGPKPLAHVERLFLSRYVPLAEADLRGVADTVAQRIRQEWAASFARSYQEGFAALRMTGKRPTMVLDVPQVASRIARLHGARAIELLLVDAMRFDLGLRVHERLRRALEGRAACAERLLLWSALPSTTPTQLDLLAHGFDALSRPADDENEMVARGRSVAMLRRIRIGSRDLRKLDVVEARIREQGGPIPQRLDVIADEVANAVSRHAETLPDRTLLFVFGDHGFVLEPTSNGSGPARQGGASPEEVLVPGFAWLVGGVH